MVEPDGDRTFRVISKAITWTVEVLFWGAFALILLSPVARMLVR